MKNRRVYLSLGGNEGNVLSCLHQALVFLSSHEEIHDLTLSHFYQTAPIEVDTPSWFVNSVCSFQTFLDPKDLFKLTQSIERQLGKVSKPKNASRPIDIDLLFYGHEIWKDEELEIPHPRWKERLFVLIPLRDLTKEVLFERQGGFERYVVEDLIQPLLNQTTQSVSLLEKNLRLQ